MIALSTNRPATEPSSSAGVRTISSGSIDMPTDMKNRPISSPRNGSMVISTSCRNSVSASSNPASSAPSAIDRPASQVSEAIPSVLSSVSAMKVSACRLAAMCRKTGRITMRPSR